MVSSELRIHTHFQDPDFAILNILNTYATMNGFGASGITESKYGPQNRNSPGSCRVSEAKGMDTHTGRVIPLFDAAFFRMPSRMVRGACTEMHAGENRFVVVVIELGIKGRK